MVRPIDSPGVSRHRQADSPAVARRLSDGGAAAADRARREVQRRGLLGDVGRGLRAPVLLRPRRTARAGRAAPVPARRVHRRGALHPPVGELLPRQARARRRRARRAPDRALPPRRDSSPIRSRSASRSRTSRSDAPASASPQRTQPYASRCSTPITRPRCPGGSGSSKARSRSSARSSSRTTRSPATGRRERTVNPYGLLSDNGSWYVIGQDLDRKDIRTFRVSRIRGDIRFATRRERDFRIPAEFDIDQYRGRPPWQIGDIVGEARIELAGRYRVVGRARIRQRRTAGGRRLRHRLLVAAAARFLDPAPGRAGDPGRARRAPTGSRRRTARRPRTTRGSAAEARRAALRFRASTPRANDPPARSCPSASPSCRHSSPTCSPPAAKATTRSSRRSEIVERFHIPAEELEEHLQLLNLVNFGGGCYTVYAALEGDTVHVDKELYGDTFRLAPRLTPLEARAIGLALEFVGPMIAADAHTPLDRVRKKLEETFGQFELTQTPEPADRRSRGRPRRDPHRGNPRPPSRRDRVPEGRRADLVEARRRALLARARAAELARAHLGPLTRRRAQLPARPDAQRAAHAGDASSRAPAFEPRGFRDARTREGSSISRASRRAGPPSAERRRSRTEPRSPRCPSAARSG